MDVESAVETVRDGIGMERSAVGVKYTDDEPDCEVETGYPVCQAILSAADGAVVELSGQSCPCPGGRTHLGLAEESNVPKETLVEGEKLWADVTVAYRSSERTDAMAEPPVGLADSVYLYPAAEGVFDPDLVLFPVDADGVARLVNLNYYWDGLSPEFVMQGSLCWSAITYPLVTGRLNVTAGDVTGRDLGEWPSHLMAVTVPAENVADLAEAVPRSTSGTADRSENFQRMLDGMRKGK
ncbi:MAG: DUF169 domain-containing protein [Haloarculaceae archaeon]